MADDLIRARKLYWSGQHAEADALVVDVLRALRGEAPPLKDWGTLLDYPGA